MTPMKIDHRILNYDIQQQLPKSSQELTEGTGEKQLLNDQKAAETVRSGQQDTVVHLSTALQEAELAKEVISSEPDVRQEKVAELKKQVASGQYKVDHTAIAGKIVDEYIDEIS
jgi:negative regulator of flagellin synthesis FlgM